MCDYVWASFSSALLGSPCLFNFKEKINISSVLMVRMHQIEHLLELSHRDEASRTPLDGRIFLSPQLFPHMPRSLRTVACCLSMCRICTIHFVTFTTLWSATTEITAYVYIYFLYVRHAVLIQSSSGFASQFAQAYLFLFCEYCRVSCHFFFNVRK